MKFTISKAGSLTTIQDSGRFGLAHMGMPVSGFMDKFAAQLANRMVSNQVGQGVLEMTWTGIDFITDTDCSIAVAGAEFECLVNDLQVSTDQVIHLSAGDEFKMSRLLQGVRAYLAVGGGFDVPQVGGSVSTLTVAQLGGITGRSIQVGDEVKLLKAGHVKDRHKPIWKKLKEQKTHVIRALPGPEIECFSSSATKQAFGQAYQLTKDCSRQGFRLNSHPIQYPNDLHLDSTGLVMGSLQVTPNGQSILAMHDAQTTGGYPRILVVNQNELHKLAQVRPGQGIYFFVG